MAFAYAAALAAPNADIPAAIYQYPVTRDGPDDQAIDLLAALKKLPATNVTLGTLDTDHLFNDHRIALEVAVLRWLGTLPGAPSAP